MQDVQALPDDRELALDQVGVSGLRHPIVVLDRAAEKQRTVADISMSVSLPREQKGTHMSRFVEALAEHHGEVTMRTLPKILRDLRERLDADSAHIEVRFPYFLERAAPVSGARALMDYECAFIGELEGERDDFVLRVRVPVTSLCPCSKAISDYGAHNQRGYVSISVRTGSDSRGEPALVWIEELVELAERCASAPVYPLLKRPDERHVTMQAYDNPVFVEDMVRNAARVLRDDPRVVWFEVHAENHESIHNHSAFARVSWGG
ncbi:GTP cyclohydrolase I FolE2 [Pseudenhygromyxa sp. WMMC2535]|uniref:GTP cyclohydrolase FolE2 n=1 Tax=Pseudenhygromyxa sp. WMMC2535 TaxID=2712867 RepID=UPI001552D2A3|nr:GTP cyclohydrolase FolE2 [Pseudenhygromyxa sp. WMMC2535]NVB38767.1 GTP cyclohydrolase I FolE2 [Pseudenhygromyxa sp. WMMC2535]